jgi:hypothetical protein
MPQQERTRLENDDPLAAPRIVKVQKGGLYQTILFTASPCVEALDIAVRWIYAQEVRMDVCGTSVMPGRGTARGRDGVGT